MRIPFKFNKQALGALVLASLVLLPSLAFAQSDDAGSVAQNLTSQFKSFADLLMGAMFLTGIGIGALSALKFKAHNENPQQTKITTPIVFALVAAFLIGLPGYLTIAKTTVLKNGQSNSLDSGAYQSIGN